MIEELHSDCDRLEKQYTYRFWEKPIVRQSFVMSVTMSLMFGVGIAIGTPMMMVPQLQKENGTIQFDSDVASWVYSIHGTSSAVTSLMIPGLVKFKGRKPIMCLICVPMLVSWPIQYLATSIKQIIIGQLFQGMTMGGVMTLITIAIAEYSDPRYRGIFLMMKAATYVWGIWVANAIGSFANWRYILIAGAMSTFYSFVATFIWPESPIWLASKGRFDECKKSFRWLRGHDAIAENELSAFIHAQQTAIQEAMAMKLKRENIFRRTVKTIALRRFYMPLLLSLALFSLYYFTGKIVCSIYVLVILKDITQNDKTAYIGMLIMDGMTVLGMYTGSYMSKKFRRRVMLFVSSSLSILFLLTMSAYLYLVRYNIVSEVPVLSVLILVLYSLSASVGPFVMCTSLFAEITPYRYKAVHTAIASMYFFVMHTACLKSAPYIFKAIGIENGFLIYSVLAVLTMTFLYVYMPETKDKTMQEISDIFEGNNCKLSEKTIIQEESAEFLKTGH